LMASNIWPPVAAVSNPLDLSRNEILLNFIKLNNDQPLDMASYMQEGRVVPTGLTAITYEFTYLALLVLVVYHRCLPKENQYYQLSFK
jgi:hypothetical protein